MKISDRNPPGEHESAIVRGHIGPLAAASSGLTTVTGGGTTVNGITGLSFSGLEVIDGGSTAVVMTKWKIPCRVATVAAGTLASSFEAGDSVDGVTLAAGDRILIKDQASTDENGIYIVASSGAPNRSSDGDDGYELLGAVVYVIDGTANTAGVFACTNTTEPTLGTDNITFARINAPGGGTGVSDWFNVKDYGAVGDGVADDTAEVNLAIAALIAAGRGVLYFPAGTYKVSSGLTTLSVPCTVMGDGWMTGASGPISQISFTSTTGTLFTVSANGCTFRDLALNQTGGTATAGSAITSTGGILATYEHLLLEGWWIGLDQENSSIWTARRCYFGTTRKYGIKVRNTASPDSGDWALSDCQFSTAVTADAAIRIESSGGGRIMNCKVNGSTGTSNFAHAVDLALITGANTSILLIANNSFENTSGHSIQGTTSAGTSKYGAIIITNNEIMVLGNTAKAISLVATTAGDFYDIIVAQNVLSASGTTRSAIQTTNCDGIIVGPNVLFTSFTTVWTATTCTNTHDYTGGVAGVDISGAPSAGMVPIASSAIAAAWGSLSTGGIAPNTVDYLVGTASAGLTAEIVVGTTPGGELGNTWASPTVDATHAGSDHNQPVRKNSTGSVFTRRRLNFIEGSNVTLTVADDAGDDEVDVTIASTGGGGGGSVATDTIWDAKGDLAAGTGADTASKLTAGANDTILMADSAQSTGLKWVASQTPSTQALSDAAAEGTADTYSRGDHKHAMPSQTWTDYTPALTATTTNPTLGSGSSVAGRYWQVGKLVMGWAKIVFGTSGTNAGSGQYEISVPVTMVNTNQPVHGSAILFDSSAGLFNVGVGYNQTTGKIRVAIGTTALVATHTSPWSWAASDSLFVEFMYEAA